MYVNRYTIVMSIGNQEIGIPRKYQYQIGIWYLCPKFLGIFLVFYRYLEYRLVKIWFDICIFPKNKNRFGIWFLWLPFHWYRHGIYSPHGMDKIVISCNCSVFWPTRQLSRADMLQVPPL